MTGKISKQLWLFFYYLTNLIFNKLPYKLKLVRITSSNWLKIKEGNESDVFLVLGNGPSLLLSDIEKLGQKIPTIASNKIFLFFEKTKWRPSYFTICDPLLSYKLKKFNFPGICTVLCPENVFYLLRGAKNKKFPWKNITLDQAWMEYERNGIFKPDPVINGFYEGFSVTNQNIQLAIWLGAKKIYLIGIDHYYNEKSEAKAGSKMLHEGQNHFHSEYRKKGEIVNNAPIDKMNDAYAKTHAIALANGVKVINISRKTALDVFPRSTVEAVLKNIEDEYSG